MSAAEILSLLLWGGLAIVSVLLLTVGAGIVTCAGAFFAAIYRMFKQGEIPEAKLPRLAANGLMIAAGVVGAPALGLAAYWLLGIWFALYHFVG